MSYGTPPPPPPGQPPYGGQPPQPPYGQNPYGGQPYGQQPVAATGDPGTLDLPWYGIGFADAIKRFFAKYSRFDGRASRSEYWFATLGLILIFLVLYVPLVIGIVAKVPVLTILFGLLFVVFALGSIVPSIALAVRRLHDGGFSGWMYLLGLVPFVGGIITLVLMCMPSKPEGAQYDRSSGGGYGGGPQYGGGYGSPYGQ
ncbi:DUF805 domain-containing protein [Nocardioides ultimimeridianus]